MSSEETLAELDPAELDAVSARLEELARALAGGKPEQVVAEAARVEAGLTVLGALGQREQQKRLAGGGAADMRKGVMQRLVRIRRQTARIAELLARGEQVRVGMAAVLALYYGVHSGAQYSPSGEPSLPNVPRLVAQG